ncbi:MAG TPA: hypothetical protein VIG99_11530, partial [Myxococcaceae bacterium]
MKGVGAPSAFRRSASAKSPEIATASPPTVCAQQQPAQVNQRPAPPAAPSHRAARAMAMVTARTATIGARLVVQVIEAPHAWAVLGVGPRLRGLRAFLVAAICLWAGLGAAGGGERRLARVLLSAKEQRRVDSAEVVQAGVPWVLPLRVMDPGRLVVKAGEQVIAECFLGWGEDSRLLVGPLTAHSRPVPLPRVANREVGQEEVEVDVPAEVAGQLLVLTYVWDWKHEGQPPMVRTWPLRAPVEEESDAATLEFERDFPLAEESPPEPELAATPEDELDEPTFFSAPNAVPLPVEVDPVQPELLWVPAQASWEEIAARLFDEPPEVGAFDESHQPFHPPAAACRGSPRACATRGGSGATYWTP